MPRALHIDPWKKTVTEIDIPKQRPLDKLQEAVGGYIECATEFENGDVLYVDEEGLLKKYDMFFDVKAHQPFAGKGIIVGPEEGDDGSLTDAKTAIADLPVTWLSLSEILMAQLHRR